MSILFWTVDSPFCRISLWSLAILKRTAEFKMHHLTWDELRNIKPGGTLGTAATVPCLAFSSEQHLSDSFRILAHLLQSNFISWLLSPDGDAYCMIEGQFSRVMYALYDGAQGQIPVRTREQWQRALRSAELAFAHNTDFAPFSAAALHVFIMFCVALQPTWREDISETLVTILCQQESTMAFQHLKAEVARQPSRVPCSWTEL